ncbi:zinc finger CCCH domain-containing protein 62-like [Phalaenopsis equestris]|uniref:zinc finger CCCH domain-containing protein 62-like n=1 Tax=Phalaenopsis equestris TaxID=78828 RepID=UPI0009E37169|nr:zinc finger CCCH domain-containing protein 62-like [Phalaenopsis equestris]
MVTGQAFQKHVGEMEEQSEYDEFESTDDSDDDPSFDIMEEIRSAISKLSIQKPRARRSKIVHDNLESESEREAVGGEIPKLDKKDEKSFEKVEELIKEGGHLEKLTLDQCKVYLRKHGLRLTGNKAVLISRIREHREIINGCGETKYPAESFVLNCKGDACLGDVVIFEQNVYDMFSIASRSATGPPCGTRTVAGRIVKESYGFAKQQHTFTIEVLWSKGVKPLQPLHQLLIKGRNLYRIKTMRQRWVDEGERLKVLQEKHGRGSHARYSREIRIKEKEKRMKGIVIKRDRFHQKNKLTGNHNPANKENQQPQNEHEDEQKVKSDAASSSTTQQKGGVLIPQKLPQSILGKPETTIFSAQASTQRSWKHEKAKFSAQASTQKPQNQQNFQYMNHRCREHPRPVNHQGFQASQSTNSAHVRPHHVYQHHYKGKQHEYMHGGHRQHKNYSHHVNNNACANRFVYVPLQQQYQEYERRPPPCHYFSQGQ